MSNTTTVNIELMRTLLNHALDGLKTTHGEDIPLAFDYFWDINPDVQYDPYTTPTEEQLTLGHVPDSWEFSQHRENDDTFIPYDVVHLANVLRALGHQFS